MNTQTCLDAWRAGGRVGNVSEDEVTTRHQSNSFIKLDDHYHQGNDIAIGGRKWKKCQNVEEAVEMAIQIGAEGFTISFENGGMKAWFHSTVESERIGYEGKKGGRVRKEDKHIGKRLYIIK